MDYLINSLSEPASYIYLSGIFLIIFGAVIGIAPPDSRKNLNTVIAIPLFVLLGLINIFRSFNLIGNVNALIQLNAILQSFVIICGLELGRRNLANAYSKKKISAWWYVPIVILLFFLSYKYDYTKRLIRRILILVSKIFAIVVTIKASKILPNYNRTWVISSFIVAFLGAIIQFVIDLHFITVVNGCYEPLPHKAIYLFYSETIATMVISILILFRRYIYEKSQRLHVPNIMSLMSPSVVYITSIIVALGVLVISNFTPNNISRVWLLYISMLFVFILYLVLYGFTYNGEKIKAIEVAQTNFELIFQHTPNPICVIRESDSVIIALNKSMQKSLGYEESLIGKKLEDLIVSTNRFNYNIPSSNDVVISECKLKKANGELFTAEVTASFIEYAENDALLLNIYDISAFKEIEDRLMEANQVKSWLLSNASHELRTPMTAIMGLSELAVSVCKEESQKEIIELLRISTKSLMSLINDMFDLAEIKDGKIKINNSIFKLKSLLDELADYTLFLSKRSNKNITYELSEGLPKYVKSDLEHIRHISMAIIDYSSNICLNNKTFLNIEFEKLDEEKGNLFFIISGIIKDYKDEIQRGIDNSVHYSDPYHASVNSKFVSRVSLQTLIVKSLGGSISIDENSKIPETLTLKIMFPVEIYNKDNLNEDLITENKYFYFNGKPLNILVADDSDVNIFLIESIITRFNGKYYSVRDGEEALEALKDNNFDCILLDIQMPNMDGITTIKEIKKLSNEKSNIPIIAISAFASEKEKNNVLQLGAQRYLVKPFYPHDLYKTISSVFKLDENLPENLLEKLPNNTKVEEESNLIEKESLKSELLNNNKEEFLFKDLKRIDYKDFKLRISPSSKNIVKLEEIYNRRYNSLDIDLDNCINNSDSAKLREVAHSLKGLVGMMSSKESWEIARFIEKKAGEGDFDTAISRIGELRMHLSEIAEDLEVIKEYLIRVP